MTTPVYYTKYNHEIFESSMTDVYELYRPKWLKI